MEPSGWVISYSLKCELFSVSFVFKPTLQRGQMNSPPSLGGRPRFFGRGADAERPAAGRWPSWKTDATGRADRPAELLRAGTAGSDCDAMFIAPKAYAPERAVAAGAAAAAASDCT